MPGGNRSKKRWDLKAIDKARANPTKDKVTVQQFKQVTEAETDIQQRLMKALDKVPYLSGTLKDYIYAIPNGGYRSKRTAITLKAEGVKPGVPDLHCFIAVAPWHSLYIEMKNETGSLSDSQKAVIPLLRQAGHKVVICRTVESALTEIFKYLGIKTT
ncbi:VRR-NUC domain-containing protein [Acinetobacter schindleri]